MEANAPWVACSAQNKMSLFFIWARKTGIWKIWLSPNHLFFLSWAIEPENPCERSPSGHTAILLSRNSCVCVQSSCWQVPSPTCSYTCLLVSLSSLKSWALKGISEGYTGSKCQWNRSCEQKVAAIHCLIRRLPNFSYRESYKKVSGDMTNRYPKDACSTE